MVQGWRTCRSHIPIVLKKGGGKRFSFAALELEEPQDPAQVIFPFSPNVFLVGLFF